MGEPTPVQLMDEAEGLLNEESKQLAALQFAPDQPPDTLLRIAVGKSALIVSVTMLFCTRAILLTLEQATPGEYDA